MHRCRDGVDRRIDGHAGSSWTISGVQEGTSHTLHFSDTYDDNVVSVRGGRLVDSTFLHLNWLFLDGGTFHTSARHRHDVDHLVQTGGVTEFGLGYGAGRIV